MIDLPSKILNWDSWEGLRGFFEKMLSAIWKISFIWSQKSEFEVSKDFFWDASLKILHLTHFMWDFFFEQTVEYRWKNIFSKNQNQLPYFKALFVGIFLPRRRSFLFKCYFKLRWGAAKYFLWFWWGSKKRQRGSKLDQRCCRKWSSGGSQFRTT